MILRADSRQIIPNYRRASAAIAVLMLAGCQYLPPIVIPTPEPSTAPSSAPTPAPSPSPTPEPTPSPSPVETPTPAPSVTPSPASSPVPGACSANGLGIVRIGIGSGGGEWRKRHWHATYRFGTAQGQTGKPCDGSHLGCNDPRYDGQGQCEPCGGPPVVCEDPRGAAWIATGGLELVSVEGGEGPYGYLATTKGKGTLTACPPPPPYRARWSGEPVRLWGKACTSVDVK